MTFMKKIFPSILLLLSTPRSVFASGPTSLRDVAELFLKIMLNITDILFALLSVGMIYGVIVYFINSDNEREREKIKGHLLWGIIGIVVVFGIWGIVSIMRYSIFGNTTSGIPQIAPPTP